MRNIREATSGSEVAHDFIMSLFLLRSPAFEGMPLIMSFQSCPNFVRMC